MALIKQYPIPPNNTRIGVHGPSGQYCDTIGLGTDWNKIWKQRLIDLHLSWFKILDDGSGSSWLTIQRLIDIDIMPVIRIYRKEPNPGLINGGVLAYIAKCVSTGAVYFETNNEPDLPLEWKNGKRPTNWLDIVVDNFITEASWIRDLGGILLFPAFGPGGKGNPFQMIVDRGRIDLFKDMGLAIHNYGLGRPLAYPYDAVNQQGTPLTQEEWAATAPDFIGDGPMKHWEMGWEEVNRQRALLKNPGSTIMDDSTCWRAFEYFDALVNGACGHSVPVFTTEGGFNVGQRAGTTKGDDPRYPKPSPAAVTALTMEMFTTSIPDYFFAQMVWLLAVGEVGLGQPNFEHQGPWYTHVFDTTFRNCNGQLPLVDVLYNTQLPKFDNGYVPAQWGSSEGEIPMAENWFDKQDKKAYNSWKENGTALNEAMDYGVKIELPVSDNKSWIPIGAFHLPGEENNRNHNVFVSLLDEAGKYLGPKSAAVGWTWEGRKPNEKAGPVELKAKPERGSVGLFGQKVSVWGLDRDSGVVSGMHYGWPDELPGNPYGHHSFYVVFMLGTVGAPPVDPDPPEEGDLVEARALLTKTRLDALQIVAKVDAYFQEYP